MPGNALWCTSHPFQMIWGMLFSNISVLAFPYSQKARSFKMFLRLFQLNNNLFLSSGRFQLNNNKRQKVTVCLFSIIKVVVRPQNIQRLIKFCQKAFIVIKPTADLGVHILPIAFITNNTYSVDNYSVIYAF